MNQAEETQLVELLRSVQCERYYDVLQKNDINVELLSLMDKAALKELGITKVGDRLRLQILISLLNLEKIRSKIPVNELVSAVTVAYSALTGVSADVKIEKAPEKTITTGDKSSANEITVITQDGLDHKVDITGCFTSSAIKRNILEQTSTEGPIIADEWSTYYMDKSNSLHLMFNIELATICNSPGREEKNRIIFCRTGEAPSQAAMNRSTKLPTKAGRIPSGGKKATPRHSMMLRNMIGQRPPSQLISTNLGEYFPNIGPSALKKVMRNSYRLSMYGNKVMKQQARQSSLLGLAAPSMPLARTTSGGSRMSRNSIYSNFSMMNRPASIVSSSTASISSPVGYRLNPTVGDVLLSNNNAIQEESGEDDTEMAGLGEESEEESEEEAEIGVAKVASKSSDAQLVKKNSHGSSGTYKSVRTSVEYTTEKNNKRTSSFIELLDDDEDGEEIVDAFKDIAEEEEASSGNSNSIESILASEINHGPSVWHKGSKIGQGSYGSVYLGLDGLTGELMAVKEVDLPTSSQDSRTKMVTALKREMNLLRELHHENIVRYLGSASDSSKMYIFLEYIPGGSVASMLHTYGPFEEPLVRNFLTQVLIGCHYLHSNGIIHRDIKGANILIDINGTVKIGDFGISKKITPVSPAEDAAEQEKAKKNRRASFQGSVYWMAPEVVKQIASTEKSDIWSVGCLAVEMFTAKHPYPDLAQMQAIFRIGMLTLPEYPANCSDAAREFLNLTFETDYKKRVSAATLLKHKFLKPLFVKKH